MKLISAFLFLLVLMIAPAQASPAVLLLMQNKQVTQSTSGPNSPIVNQNSSGSVTIVNQDGNTTVWKDGKKFVNGKEMQEEAVWPSGPSVRKERVTKEQMKKVTGIRVDGAISVFTRINEETSEGVTFNAPENIQKTVDFSIDSNGILVINHRNSTLVGQQDVIVYLQQPLQTIQSSGATNVYTTVVGPRALTVETSGASSVHLAKGGTTMLNLYASGSSRILASEVIVSIVNVDASGASCIAAKARDSFSGKANGASTVITYGATPKIKTSGAARVDVIPN